MKFGGISPEGLELRGVKVTRRASEEGEGRPCRIEGKAGGRGIREQIG